MLCNLSILLIFLKLNMPPTHTVHGHFLSHKHTHAHNHTKEEVDEGEDFSKLTSTRLIHLSQPVTPIPSLLPVLFPASLFSIKCQDWPLYNHICDLGSGIQMQSMSIRIMGLLIERGEMVWGISPISILSNIVHIFAQWQSMGSVLSCLQVVGALQQRLIVRMDWNQLRLLG